VRGDDVRLKQVFWNVIKNAAKFTPEAGQIIVETVQGNSNDLVVKVTDTGIGMTTAELERVFEAFAQGDHAVQSGPHRFGGIGLGLAISRMMVKLHGGSISATSGGRNQGTTVAIKLPLFQISEQALAATNHTSDAAPGPPANGNADRPRRVLLVEDHPSTAQTLSQLLTRRKYEVVVANCLADARAHSSREKFDLLISDIGLPDGNGCDLMMELRNRHGLVGIALTGYGMEEDVSRSHAAGFFTQLTKPVSVQALDTALSAACRASNGG
jgi:CheY-like chemotaxis protein